MSGRVFHVGKAFNVKRDGKKIRLEQDKFYGCHDASAKIRRSKSKKVKPVSIGFAGLFGKGRGTSAK